MGNVAYEEFLFSIAQAQKGDGFAPLWMPDAAFDFQKYLIEWTLMMGRSSVLIDCGMGKSIIELAWGENMCRKLNRPVLLLTPLAVGRQMLSEGEKFGIEVVRCNDGNPTGKKVHVSNYEKLHHFRPEDWGAVVCDEASCLKAFDGKRRGQVTEFLRTIKYRLMATATAAPNDYIELGTLSEALGVMGQTDMLNRFFKNDQNTTDMRSHCAGFLLPGPFRNLDGDLRGMPRFRSGVGCADGHGQGGDPPISAHFQIRGSCFLS